MQTSIASPPPPPSRPAAAHLEPGRAGTTAPPGLGIPGRLFPVFQPVADLRTGRIHGHEALIRGWHEGALQMPAQLLRQAAEASQDLAFELHCVELALCAWVSRGQPGRLFVNLSPDVLLRAGEGAPGGSLRQRLAASGASPRRVVVELTEQGSAASWPELRQAVQALRTTGVQLALDDFGEAQSNLRRWAELRPDYVKIDKFFTRGIATTHENAEVVRALQQVAAAMGSQLVAEGITDADDLRLLRDLDVAFGQGHFIGSPAREFADQVAPTVRRVLGQGEQAVMPRREKSVSVMRSLPRIEAPTLAPDATNDEVSRIFQAHAELHALAVVQDQRPMALIDRHAFMNRYAQLYFREVHGRKPALAHANRRPRLIELDADLQRLSAILMSSDQRYLQEGFVFTDGGKYLGLGTGDQLVRAVTETRIEAARHANPLTSLPGNIPINVHVERLLIGGADFVACYVDLDHFKAFNDHYGYRRGDEMILAVADLLGRWADARRDFVGHIGGDDFIVLFQSADWAARCVGIVEEFDGLAGRFYDEDDRAAGGIEAEDRHGIDRFFPISSLSIGAVAVAAGTASRADEVANAAAQAKHEAKLAPSGIATLALTEVVPALA